MRPFFYTKFSVGPAIYDSYAMRKFMGINFFEQDVPDAATLLHFRHLLEEKGIGRLLFDAINRCLERAGRMMRGGSIVDATLIQRTQLDQECGKETRPRNAPDKEGKSMAFRYEVPHRRGCRQQFCPYSGSHRGQCPRCNPHRNFPYLHYNSIDQKSALFTRKSRKKM